MTTFLWDQHQVGGAGFESEQTYQVFRKSHENKPWIHQPIVAGSSPADVLDEIEDTTPWQFVKFEHAGGITVTYKRDLELQDFRLTGFDR